MKVFFLMADQSNALLRAKSKNFKVFRELIQFLAPYKKRIALAFVAMMAVIVASLAMGQGVRYLIDDGFSATNPDLLNIALLSVLGLAVIMSVGAFFRFYLVSWIGERVVADMRVAVYQQILKLDVAFFETTKTGEVLSRLTTDTTLLQSVIGSSVSMALRSLLTFIGCLVMIFVTNVKLSVLILVVVPLVVLPIVILGKKVRLLSKDSQDRVADVGAYAEETINAITTVQAYTHEPHDYKRFDRDVTQAFVSARKRIKVRGLLTALAMLLIFSAVGGVLWVGGRDVMAGEISGGELAAFLFYAVIMASNVGMISEVMGELQRAAGATERLVELLKTEPALKTTATPVSLPAPAKGEVCFEGVTFRYPSRPDRIALDGVNLDVKAGETIAFVGPSGAGKTTLFQLLMRFYDPEAGRVVIDGVDAAHADPQDIRRRMALVAQDPVVFSANGWDNIRYGRPEATDAEVRAAADAAQVTEFMEKLPQGFDSFLGEKGTRLSGGQRQRLSIARALLRDPAILLLDEATSALDAENERIVQAALEQLMKGRTTFIIAHRLATVKNVDRIFVVEEGRVIATGSHEELVRENALYARLASLQFAA